MTNTIEGVLSKPIGIPPYITIAVQPQSMVDLISLLRHDFSSQKEEIIDCITSVIDKKVLDSGNITESILKEILQEYENKLEAKMSKLNHAWKEMFYDTHNHTLNNQILDDSNYVEDSTACTSAYDGKFWDVPKEYEFPAKIKLKNSLIFWLYGHNINDIGTTKIKPF